MLISAPVRCPLANIATGTGQWSASCRNSKSQCQISRKRSKLLGKAAELHDIGVLRRTDDLVGETELQELFDVQVIRPHRLGVDSFGNGHVVIAAVAVPTELNPLFSGQLISGPR